MSLDQVLRAHLGAECVLRSPFDERCLKVSIGSYSMTSFDEIQARFNFEAPKLVLDARPLWEPRMSILPPYHALTMTGGAITSANLQQHQHSLEMQRLESHQLAANYASLAPPQYAYESSAASTSYNSEDTQRLSFSSSDSRELATPEEAVDVWPFVSAHKDVRSPQHIQALESQSEDIMAQREQSSQLQRPAPLERFSSSATMTTTKASQAEELPDMADLTIGPDASWHDVKRGVAARNTMASPDSWRSLLPEHDPYFASDTLKSNASHRSASPAATALLHPESPARTRRNTFVTDYGSSTTRSSLSSANSSSSLTSSSNAPSTSDYPADSWRSLLPESDRFHHASPDTRSLPLPSLHHALESSAADLTNPRLAFSALGPDSERVARDVAAKRHASFSAIEADTTQSAALSSLRDGIRAYPSTSSLQNEMPRPEERDSWPCNRQTSDLQKLVLTTPEKKKALTSCSVDTPQSPCTMPFLDHRAAAETNLTIETAAERYTLVMSLPGFSLDCITLATKQHQHHRTLHIVADKWDAESGGHFERRVTFPDKQCDLKNVKAEFDGTLLRVYVPRT